MLIEEEYKALFLINLGRTNLNWLSDAFHDEAQVRRILKVLEEKGMIKIEIRERDIYAFIETEKGKEELLNKKYRSLYEKMEEDY